MDLSCFFFLLANFEEQAFYEKRRFFCIFALPHRENFQKIYNRTILKFDALPIAHIEAGVPLFSKHLWKLAIRLKLWVLAHSEVSWSRTMTAKMSVFRPLFWPKNVLSVIHGWKATDLLFIMIERKKNSKNPISRQNFAYAFAETHNLNLEVWPR